MTTQGKTYLKTRFSTGAYPVGQDFSDLIDSLQRQSIIDVRDYGTVGDGATDDSAAIQAAITAAIAGTKRVYLPAATYAIGALTLDSNVSILAAPGTTLKHAAGSGTVLLTINGKNNVVIDGVAFDGNHANVTGNNSAIAVYNSSSVTIRNCAFNDFRNVPVTGANGLTDIEISGCSFTSNGQSGSSVPDAIFLSGNVARVRISNCTVNTCLSSGIVVTSSGTGTITDIIISECIVTACQVIGIWVAGHAEILAERVTVIGCTVTACRDNIELAYCVDSVISGCIGSNSAGDTAGDGIVLQNCTRCAVTGCTAQVNRARGINLQDSSWCVVTGNSAYYNNADNVAGCGGIDLYNASLYNLVSGNHCDGASGHQKYGIQEAGTGADYNYIAANRTVGNETGQIAKIGSNTKVRNNFGHVTENSGLAVLNTPNTSLVVSHGLSVTPTYQDVTLSFVSDPGASVILWSDTFTDTQFTLHVSASLGSNTTIAWRAICL